MVDYNKQQFVYAKSNGWLPYFIKAGRDYDWPPALLMALASRETNMRNIVGDGGHGYGLMQIDVRTAPDFCHSGVWRNVELGIQKGAQILDAKRTEIEHGYGHSLHVGGYTFLGRQVDAVHLTRVSVAAYNCGLWAYYCYSKGEDPDRLSTGHNYSADVLRRMVEFTELLGEGHE